MTQHDPVFRDCEVEYVPIFLGGLMHKVCLLFTLFYYYSVRCLVQDGWME